MVRCGILADDDRLELLDGALVVKEPQGPEHSDVSALVADKLRTACGGGVHARLHSPVAAGPKSLPEPDVALCKGSAGQYTRAYPGPEDILLVVELAAGPPTRERRKIDIYARAGIREYWLLDLRRERLHVYQEPTRDGTYARVTVLTRPDSVAVPGSTATLSVAALLPPA